MFVTKIKKISYLNIMKKIVLQRRCFGNFWKMQREYLQRYVLNVNSKDVSLWFSRLIYIINFKKQVWLNICCTIWYHLYDLKNVKHRHELYEKQNFPPNSYWLQALAASNFIKSNTPWRVFLTFLNCRNGAESRKAWLCFYTIPKRRTITNENLYVFQKKMNVFCFKTHSFISVYSFYS